MKFRYHMDFSSVAELTEARISDANRDTLSAYYADEGGDWWGCSGPTEVDWLTREGWPVGVMALGGLVTGLEARLPRLRHAKRRVHRGAQGDELDVHSIINGNVHRAWRGMKPVEMPGQGRSNRVRIVLQIGAPSYRTSLEMFYGPAAGLVLADRLLKQGRDVEIVGASVAEGLGADDWNMLIKVTLKPFDRPINIENLAIVCLSGFFRKYMFAAMASQEKVRPHFGRHVTLEVDHVKRNDCRTLVASDIWTEDDAVTWIEGVEDETAK